MGACFLCDADQFGGIAQRCGEAGHEATTIDALSSCHGISVRCELNIKAFTTLSYCCVAQLWRDDQMIDGYHECLSAALRQFGRGGCYLIACSVMQPGQLMHHGIVVIQRGSTVFLFQCL